MIALALLQRFPTSVVAVTGAAITLSHNLLDPIRSDKLDRAAPAWTLLHQPGFLQSHGKPIALVAYPLLPWIGVMCLGYAFGAWVGASPAFRRKASTALGIVFLRSFCPSAVGEQLWGRSPLASPTDYSTEHHGFPSCGEISAVASVCPSNFGLASSALCSP
jgi:uncharacterized membrane protein